MGSVAIFKGKLVKFLAKAGLLMPSRPQTERSTSPTAGEIAFNNTTNKLEMFDGSTWITFDNAPSADPTDIAGIPPSLDLDFSADVPSTVTFSRNSIATYFGQDGYLKTASANVPRIEHDPVTRDVKGLLIEEQRSNLLTRTEKFDDTSAWLKTRSNIVLNFEVAPDGSYTANKLIIDNTPSTSHYVYANGVAVSSNTVYTYSVFLKAAETTWAFVYLSNDTDTVGYGTYVNLTNGTLGYTLTTGSPTTNTTNRKIESVGNGWYRVSITANLGAFTTCDCSIYLAQDNNITLSAGDNKSGIYLWGAQLEAGAFPTSYIPSAETWTGRTGMSGTAESVNATYYDASGILRTTSGAVARYTYNPDPARLHLAPKLLLEPERTNLLQRSEQFENSYWNKLNITTSSNTSDFVAPDGLNFSDKILETATTAEHYIERLTISTTTNTPYTLSVFVKQLSRRYIGLSVFDSVATNKFSAQFDLTNALVGATGSNGTGTFISASIVPLINGWYRISLTGIPSSTDSGSLYSARIALLGDGPATSYLGDITKGCYLWGAQLEAGYEATSYIKTDAATVKRYADSYTSAAQTRLRDDASMTGSAFTGWYRWDEGTFFTEFDSKGSTTDSGTAFCVNTTNGITEDLIACYAQPGVVTRFRVRVKGSDNALLGPLSYTAESTVKIAAGFKLNDFGATVGSILYSDTVGLIPFNVSSINIGAYYTPGNRMLNGHIRRLIFWPKRIDNDKLIIMTK